MAAESGNERLVWQLLKRQARIYRHGAQQSGRTALQAAAGAGYENFSPRGIFTVGRRGGGGEDAGEGNHDELVKQLLDEGTVHINALDSNNRTELHLAAMGSHDEVVKLLLDKGNVDIRIFDSNNQTSLHLAAEGDHHEATLLLDNGRIDINGIDSNTQSALHLATGGGHDEVVTVLLQKGKVDINALDPNKQTPLSRGLQPASSPGSMLPIRKNKRYSTSL